MVIRERVLTFVQRRVWDYTVHDYCWIISKEFLWWTGTPRYSIVVSKSRLIHINLSSCELQTKCCSLNSSLPLTVPVNQCLMAQMNNTCDRSTCQHIIIEICISVGYCCDWFTKIFGASFGMSSSTLPLATSIDLRSMTLHQFSPLGEVSGAFNKYL
jgi:hypothetical protein